MAMGAGPDVLTASAGRQGAQIPAPRTSTLLVLGGLFTVQMSGTLSAPFPRQGLSLGLGLLSALIVFALQLLISSPGAMRWPMRRRLGVLAAQAAFTYLPLIAVDAEWAGMTGFLAGSILILMPVRVSYVPFAAVIVSVLLASLSLGASARGAAYLTVASLSNGLTVFGISRLCLASRRAHGASVQLAQLASVRERERFSRDLHDFLGYSLSAITLKAELTKRLVESNPLLAHAELAEVVTLARQTSADIRQLASGYRSISLVRETATAACLLTAADIAVHVDVGCGALEDKIDTVLAMVLREAIANILRHSEARRCVIEAEQEEESITLAVINDGVTRRVTPRNSGYGLENLAWRLEAVGGELITMTGCDDRFSLVAKVPMPRAPGGQRHGSDDAPAAESSPPADESGGLAQSFR